MTHRQALQLFEKKKVRTLWDSEQEKWYFSIVDVILVLTDSTIPRRYWTDLKKEVVQRRKPVVRGYRTTENAICRWKIL